MTKIEERQKETAIDNFYFHISSEIKVNQDDLKSKFKHLNYDKLKELLFDIMLGNSNTRSNTLRKLKIPVIDKFKETNELKEEVKKALNLQDITEFGSNDAYYFKFKDQNGNITIVRNLGDDSKVLFSDILNNTDLANSQNGKQNTSDIFKFLKNKKFIEIGLTNSENIDEKTTPKHKKRVLDILKEKVKNRPIIISNDEDLYVIKGNTSSEDIIFKGTYENGHYNVKPLIQKSYGVKIDANSKKENGNTDIEVPNDIVIELDNNKEISDIIEGGLNLNLTDDQIKNIVEENINGKHHKYRSLPNLAVIIMTVISLKRKKREENHSNSLSGRQKILFNPNAPKLINDEEQAIAA